VRPHGSGVAAIGVSPDHDRRPLQRDAAESCFTSGCSGITTFGSLVPEAAIAATDRPGVFNNYNNEIGGCQRHH